MSYCNTHDYGYTGLMAIMCGDRFAHTSLVQCVHLLFVDYISVM